MREKLKDYIYLLFRNAPDTERTRELREEILQNSLDRYDDLIAQGNSEGEAYAQAVSNIGDVEQLWVQEKEPVRAAKKSRTGWIVAGCVAGALVLLALIVGAILCLNWSDRSGRGGNDTSFEGSAGAPADGASSGDASVGAEADNVSGDSAAGTAGWSGGREDGRDEHRDEDRKESSGDQSGAAVTSITYDHAEQYSAGPVELPAEGIREIYICWVAGTITVEACDGDTISVTETEQTDESLQLHWRQNGAKLYIQPFSSGSHTDVPSKDLLVQIPASLELKTLEVDDSMSADTSVRGLTVNSFEFESVSGGLEFTGTIRREAELDTVSGQFVLDLTETPDELSFDSVSGNITLTLPDGRGFRAELETVSGSFSCDYETRQSGSDTWTYAGTGSGSQAELEFDTTSGSVEINSAA